MGIVAKITRKEIAEREIVCSNVHVIKQMNKASTTLYKLFIGTASHVNITENTECKVNLEMNGDPVTFGLDT